MKISKEAKFMHNRLSLVNSKFREYVKNHPEALKRSAFRELEMDDWLFKLHPWPTFISKQTKKEFRDAVLSISNLMKILPQRLFNNDPDHISEYYRLPKAVTKLQMEYVTPHHIDCLLGRGDFIVTPTGAKCIEYSFSANLGGLEAPLWEARALKNPVIANFLKENQIDVKNRDMLKILLEHSIDTCINQKHSPVTGTELNTVWVVQGVNNEVKTDLIEHLKRIYRELLQKKYPDLSGELIFCDYNHLSYQNKCTYFKEKRLHNFLEAYAGLVAPQVLSSFQAGNIHLCTGPIGDILSNKLNLALLSDTDNHHLFSEAELSQIETYIPWTRRVEAKNTTYQRTPINLESFIRENREKIVLKTSLGYGGKNVFIGNQTPASSWDTLVTEAVKAKNWLVQEYTTPTRGIYQAGEEGYAEHDIVWGFFLFGSRYGGAWTRMIPVIDNKGAINCHQGATVSVILEVDD